MAAALQSHWRCLDPGCPEAGEGTAEEVDKAAAKHSKTTKKAGGHGTICWSEPPLPIPIPGVPAGR
jgi:hypothetical protein